MPKKYNNNIKYDKTVTSQNIRKYDKNNINMIITLCFDLFNYSFSFDIIKKLWLLSFQIRSDHSWETL